MSPQEIKALNDTINMVCRFIVYLGGLAAAITGIWALITKIKSKGTVAKMQKRLDDQDKKIDRCNHRIDDHERRLDGLDVNLESSSNDLKDMHELSKLTLSAVQELLKSNLQDGNNHAGMQKASDDIDKYLKDLI